MRFSISIILLLVLTLPLNAQSQEGGQLGAKDFFSKAIEAQKQGEIKPALSFFRQAAEEKNFALSDYAQFEIGEIYYSSGDYLSAIPEYYRLVVSHPQSILLPRAYLMLGKSYFNLKDFTQAIKNFQHLTKKYPEAKEVAEARFLRAKALQLQGKWKEAYFAFEETDLYHPLSYFGKKARQAANFLKRKYKKKLPRYRATAEALFKKGMSYFDQGDFEMAANVFSRLAREYPHSKYVGEAWLMLGRAEMQTKKGIDSAISDLEKATRGPSNLAGRAHYYLGLAYGRQGRFEFAIASLKKVTDRYPDSGLADDAAYWIGYYQEMSGDVNGALNSYYHLINNYPYSKAVPAAIWRMGRIYYWSGDFKNAATYLHLAQLYPPTEDTPRCYFFEAKALERLGNRAAALEIYKKLVERFDHTYYAYRAQEKLAGLGISSFRHSPFNGEEFSTALSNLDEKNQEELAAIMEIWEQTNADILQSENSEEARVHLEKYKELMDLGLTKYAADEAYHLAKITSDVEKEPLQTKLGEALINSGNYRMPIRFADRKIKAAVLAGKSDSLPKKIWQMAYPKGYWKNVTENAKEYGLDPYLVLAVIREESRFNPKATSRSNAKGLMQIMPQTGRSIAKNLEIRRYRTSKLYEPAINIEMGVYYLSNLIKNFSNNIYPDTKSIGVGVYLALAGYNGGPNRIKRYLKSWYNGNLDMVDIDEFIESIPVRETRLYVQKVMGSFFEYRRLYEGKRG